MFVEKLAGGRTHPTTFTNKYFVILKGKITAFKIEGYMLNVVYLNWFNQD